MSVSGEGRNHEYIKRLKANNIPLVFFDRVYDDIDVPKITTDDYSSSFKATEYLLKHGCKKPAFLVIDKNISIGNTRMNGFIDAHKKCKIPVDKCLIIDCSNDLDESYRIIEKILLHEKPDALLASVERLAIAAYRVCMNEKIPIPQQVKVISYSNLFVTDMLNPSLSTIEQPAESLGAKAAEILFDTLNHKSLSQKNFVLTSKIIHRKSTEFL
jgi:LacI family transcriptional regulator